MPEGTVSLLAAWQNFYVIIGSAAGALTGLMFVAITLIAGYRGQGAGATDGSVSAFGTPTVVHFCAALLIAGNFSAPWPDLWQAAVLPALTGLSGVAYVVIVIWRTRQQTSYTPVFEDWLWHTIFPLLAYLTYGIGSLVLLFYSLPALFALAAATVLLLFIGIHNAWDTVTYVTLERLRQDEPPGAVR